MKREFLHANSSKYEYIFLVAEISAALWVHIVTFETTLRNFLARNLKAIQSSEEWWKNDNLFAKDERLALSRCLRKLSTRRMELNSENLISNLSLSFWVKLLGKRYHETIWLKIVGYFPVDPGRRSEFHRKAREIRNLRNSIAHHGPIMRRNQIGRAHV